MVNINSTGCPYIQTSEETISHTKTDHSVEKQLTRESKLPNYSKFTIWYMYVREDGREDYIRLQSVPSIPKIHRQTKLSASTSIFSIFLQSSFFYSSMMLS